MSMCPNPDLFSALYDGEVPSPWKEKLEGHLSHCAACAARFARYGTIGKAMKAGISQGEPNSEWLAQSFDRLLTRGAAAESTLAERARSAWAERSVKLSLPALAAMLIAAVILPSTLILVASRGGNAAQTAQFASVMPVGTMNVSRETPVYSPDPLPQSVAGQLLVSNESLFNMVNYARRFSTDESLFDDAQIIIIKLPDLTHFGGSEDPIFTNKDTLQSSASFIK